MSWLINNKRSNVLYKFAKGLGTMRDESDSLLPVKRMPMGLIEHTSNFYISMVNTLMYVFDHDKLITSAAKTLS